ncbi:MAG: VOC family protein [Labilithrix sp.]|nr:VOC family protein [Labilithrix sp.]MCW5810736.1 VOC family protein [Labilithrix sp.]
MVTLFVRDAKVAVRFYVETLGMKLVAERDGAATLDAGDGFLVELQNGALAKTRSEDGTPSPRGEAPVPLVTFYPKVPLAEAIAIYENRGVVFDEDGRFADADGNALCLRAR